MAATPPEEAAPAPEPEWLDTAPGIETEKSSSTAGDAPRVSVVIPAYNHEDYIDEAIESVLTQTSPDLELIIVNDGSTDQTEARVLAHQDPRIRYFAQDNRGAPAAINRGITLATGHYVSILNSDDSYAPDRLAKLQQILDSDPSLVAAFSQLRFVDAQGETRSDDHADAAEVWSDQDGETSFRDAEHPLLHLLAGNFVCTTSNLFCRRSVFDEIEGFQPYRYLHDYEFLLRLCLHGRTRVVPEPLINYRIHERNTIKESEPATDFERGIVLTSFLLDHDLGGVFPDSDPELTALKFLNSFNPRHAGSMVLTLYLLGQKGYLPREIMDRFRTTADGRFRLACEQQFREAIRAWEASRDVWADLRQAHEELTTAGEENRRLHEDGMRAWAKWKETSDRLVTIDGQLKEELEKNDELWQERQRAFAEVEAAEQKTAEVWQERQDAWAKVTVTNATLAQLRDENRQLWEDGQAAWAKWRETNDQLTEIDRRLAETLETNQQIWGERQDAHARLNDTTLQLDAARSDLEVLQQRITKLEEQHRAMMASRSWRLARAISWPVRVVRSILAPSRSLSDRGS